MGLTFLMNRDAQTFEELRSLVEARENISDGMRHTAQLGAVEEEDKDWTELLYVKLV